MTTYEQLHKRICELIPEIKELKFRCKVILFSEEYSNNQSQYLVLDKRDIKGLDTIVELCEKNNNGVSSISYKEKRFLKIIGRDITLEDCLLAIGEGYAGEMTEIREGKLYWKFDSDEPMFNWQLNKPLQEQSEDTQKAILALIE